MKNVHNLNQEVAEFREMLKSSGGGGTYDGMEQRVRQLEIGHAVVAERIDSLGKRMDDRFDDLSRKIDRLPNEWAMARVVFYVAGALMAAAILGPRLISMIPAS